MKTLLKILPAFLLLLFIWQTSFALPGPATIDGDPGDWAGAICQTDPGGVDDESSPTKADITQYCTHLDSNNLYLGMAWDNTGFSGGNASTAGVQIDVTGDGVIDFFILSTLTGNPATLDSYSIASCPGGACNNADDVCSSAGGGGGPCTGAQGMSGSTWDDPFDPLPGHGGGNVCTGTNCTMQDSFAELAIPWSLLGFSGPPNPQVFANYGSYPSGPAQAPKDDTGLNGLTCLPTGQCYPSTPTAVSFQGLSAHSHAPQQLIAFALGGLFLTIVAFAFRRRRALVA